MNRVRYYTTRVRAGRTFGYWQPTAEMRQAGFKLVTCGEDGPAARALAEEWNDRWDELRRKGNYQPKRKLEPRKVGFVYFLRAGAHTKIGFSLWPWSRVKDLKTAIAERIDRVVVVAGTMADEKATHKAFAASRTNGEWFTASFKLERFILDAASHGIHTALMRTQTEQKFNVKKIQSNVSSEDHG